MPDMTMPTQLIGLRIEAEYRSADGAWRPEVIAFTAAGGSYSYPGEDPGGGTLALLGVADHPLGVVVLASSRVVPSGQPFHAVVDGGLLGSILLCLS